MAVLFEQGTYMSSRGPRAERIPPKKDWQRPCERNCPHFVEWSSKTKSAVVCLARGRGTIGAAPPADHKILCIDHPQFQGTRSRDWIESPLRSDQDAA